MVKVLKGLVVPIVGVWYHFIAKKKPGVNHRSFCLCIKLDECDPSVASLYVRVGEEFVLYTVSCEVIKEANWMGTNRFHQFCLNRLNNILETGLSLEELQKDCLFNLYFDFATQFRIFRAKNEHNAIDRTYDVMDKKLRSELLTQEEKDSLALIHKQLLRDFKASIEYHLH